MRIKFFCRLSWAILLYWLLAGCGDRQSAEEFVATTDSLIAIEEQKIAPSELEADDFFGHPVAVLGDTLVAGAHNDDDYGSQAGAAYIFTRNGTVWTQLQKLTSSDAGELKLFGYTVAISGDTILVGAHGWDMAVYVFVLNGNSWVEQQKVKSSDWNWNNFFGVSLVISGDTFVIGDHYFPESDTESGTAQVYTRSGTTWTRQQKLVAPDVAAYDHFGMSVAISSETVAVGSHWDDDHGEKSGSAHVFIRDGNSWTHQQKLTASDAAEGDTFGYPLAISGDTIVVGAPRDDDHGPESGSAYFFTRSGTTWTQQQKITASDAAEGDYFGSSVAISGNVLIIGAFKDDDGGLDTGSLYVFTRSGNSWTERHKLTASDPADEDYFGASVSFSGGTIAASSNSDDHGVDSGAVYILRVLVENGEPCTGTFPCQSGNCVDGLCCDTPCGSDDPYDCQACSVSAGAAVDGVCTVFPDDQACDDGDLCTDGDKCSGGACSGIAYSCNDDNPCTDDICEGGGSCSYVNNDEPCDDGLPWTEDDHCVDGTCIGTDLGSCDSPVVINPIPFSHYFTIADRPSHIDAYSSDCGGIDGSGVDVVYELLPITGESYRVTVGPTPAVDVALVLIAECAQGQECLDYSDKKNAGSGEEMIFTAKNNKSHFVVVEVKGQDGGYTLRVTKHVSDDNGCSCGANAPSSLFTTLLIIALFVQRKRKERIMKDGR